MSGVAAAAVITSRSNTVAESFSPPAAFELDELTIADLQSAMAAGKFSAHSLAKKYLDRIDELAAYLFREDDFPKDGVLSTGTSLVPDLPFTLRAGDEIRIKIRGIGELINLVARGKAAVWATKTR